MAVLVDKVPRVEIETLQVASVLSRNVRVWGVQAPEGAALVAETIWPVVETVTDQAVLALSRRTTAGKEGELPPPPVETVATLPLQVREPAENFN